MYNGSISAGQFYEAPDTSPVLVTDVDYVHQLGNQDRPVGHYQISFRVLMGDDQDGPLSAKRTLHVEEFRAKYRWLERLPTQRSYAERRAQRQLVVNDNVVMRLVRVVTGCARCAPLLDCVADTSVSPLTIHNLPPFLADAIYVEDCHVSGDHDPEHTPRYVCTQQLAALARRLLAVLGVDLRNVGSNTPAPDAEWNKIPRRINRAERSWYSYYVAHREFEPEKHGPKIDTLERWEREGVCRQQR